MLAVCIKGGWLRYTQADIGGHSFKINCIDSLPLPSELSPPELGSPGLRGLLHDVFEQVADALEKPDREVFVSLDPEWIDCTLLKSDAVLDEATKESYLRWILAQRWGTLWNESAVFFQAVPNGDEGEELTVACTTTENLVESVRSSIDSIGYVPSWLESTSLSVYRTVKASDDGRHSKAIVAVARETILDAQFIDRGRLRSFGVLNVRSGKVKGVSLQGDADFADRCIEEWNSYLNDSDKSPNLRIVLTGEFTKPRFSALKGNEAGDGVTDVIDPFPRTDISGMGSSRRKGSPFVELLGLIQRRAG
ncbi:MAG: hypothetical protein QGG85_00290 [Candidatus Marinimicrobia bacterium]|nr:hypothetical protein [Candidatus Neomarinimicrobiota bacterium]